MSDSFGNDEAEGWLGGIVADEDDLDRHAMWRLGLWGVAAVGALTLGILSGQLPINAAARAACRKRVRWSRKAGRDEAFTSIGSKRGACRRRSRR